jgi:fused signal recognition particle receptor
MTFFGRLRSRLSRFKFALGSQIRALFGGKVDEETLAKLEKILYEADFGVVLTQELMKRVRRAPPEQAVDVLKSSVLELLKQTPVAVTPKDKPWVILIVGVNGNGKTTSVAKLAHRYKDEGKKVILAAGDTFRAAAIEQLQMWAQRLGVDCVKGASGGDPASVAYDAIQAARARDADVVIIDTAGRLQNKGHLMAELEKIGRVCNKALVEAPHETLLVIDATTGQNALDQALVFNSATRLTGLVLTKLDGTAKGGIVVAIQKALNVPVRYVGLGEGIDDLEPFDPEAFVQALFGS